MILSVYIDGTPRPQPRARHVGGGRVVSLADKNAKLWKARVMAALMEARKGAARVDRACSLWCVAMFATPKADRWGKHHTFRPDKDNLEKLVMDAMTKAGTLKDDSLICDGAMRKVWAERAGMSIMLMEADERPTSEAEDLGALVIAG